MEENAPTPGVYNTVRWWRTKAAMTQEQLAASAGISRRTLQHVESGTQTPSMEVALLLARALDTNIANLFSLGTAAEHAVREMTARELAETLLAMPDPDQVVTFIVQTWYGQELVSDIMHFKVQQGLAADSPDSAIGFIEVIGRVEPV